MPSPLTRTSSILIIGGGTWGASTALHLARQGYQNVTVLDSYALPSAISAGNDVNKIKGWQNSDPASSSSSSGQGSNAEEYTREKIAYEANQAWLQDEIFKPYYHETGYVIAASQPQHIQNLYEEENPTAEKGFEELNSAQDFRNTMPEGVLTGDFPGWKGWFKREGCGWVHARKALVATLLEAERLGVKLVTGNPCGAVQSLWFDDDDNDSDNDGNRNDVRGAITADGKHHLADRTILCAGANAPQLLDMKDQLRPTAWTLAHIQLTREETALYKNLPVLFNVERGFFMEPDEDQHQLKICDEHPGYCNWVTTTTTDKNNKNKKISLPFPKNQIPLHSESNIRLFLHETMPHLSTRPFTFARMCWCADTPNRDFLITRHPEYARLTLGVGASGHGYKYIPVIGKYIVQAMQEKLEPNMQYTWRWRPETAVGRDWEDVQGRMGGSYKVLNLAEIGDEEWTCIGGAEAKL